MVSFGKVIVELFSFVWLAVCLRAAVATADEVASMPFPCAGSSRAADFNRIRGGVSRRLAVLRAHIGLHTDCSWKARITPGGLSKVAERLLLLL